MEHWRANNNTTSGKIYSYKGFEKKKKTLRFLSGWDLGPVHNQPEKFIFLPENA